MKGQRPETWEERCEDWQLSGLFIADFSRQNGLRDTSSDRSVERLDKPGTAGSKIEKESCCCSRLDAWKVKASDSNITCRRGYHRGSDRPILADLQRVRIYQRPSCTDMQKAPPPARQLFRFPDSQVEGHGLVPYLKYLRRNAVRPEVRVSRRATGAPNGSRCNC